MKTNKTWIELKTRVQYKYEIQICFTLWQFHMFTKNVNTKSKLDS
jgi:hypothetical protein